MITFGYMWDDDSGHAYVGAGVGLPGSAATCSDDPITPGLNWGAQGSLVISVQGGASIPGGDEYTEKGVGTPGGAATIFWVFD